MGNIIIREKKGIFFTFIAITIIAVFIVVFKPSSDIALKKDTQAIKTRIISVDNYVSDLEARYLETVLRSASYKTILSLIYYMNVTNSYISNFDATFSEVILNGSILKPGEDHMPIDTITGKKIMDNNTITNWTTRIVEAAKDTLNVETNISIHNVSINQLTPWDIEAKLIFNISVKSEVAEWNKSTSITTTFSLEEFPDPYYLVNTDPSYTNNIKRSSVTFDEWNLTYVREHLRNGTYVYWQNPNAPSFLMRFTNTITSSPCCGIESLVNPNMITPSDQIESYVDYILFDPINNIPCTELYNITKPPTNLGLWDEFPYFKLDIDHVTKYNITGEYAIKTLETC